MGKQSARIVYRGKDHKDIYFRGKYHDAMYLGYELLWYKIRKEGYYSLIVGNGKEGKFEKGLYVITFDENTRDFKIVMEILDNPDMYTESYFGGLYTVDSYTTYICSISGDDTVWASTDGIHFEKTNLIVKRNTDASFWFLYSASYFEDYVWNTSVYGTPNMFNIEKCTITKNGNQYTINKKTLNTQLKSSEGNSTDVNYLFHIPKYGDSRFALHTKDYTWKEGRNEYSTYTLSYYDTKKEVSGKITEFEYNSFKYNGNNPISRDISTSKFFHVNGVYIFIIQDYYETFRIEKELKYYLYYSFDGVMYNNSLMYERYITQSDYNANLPNIELVIHRKGMYYIYAGAEIDEYYNPQYTLFLTTDFKNFQKRKIPHEIQIGGETINTLKLIRAEAAVTNKKRRYFYFGEVSEPEDGILTIYEDSLVYIDNMFFKESNGNKIFHYKEG